VIIEHPQAHDPSLAALIDDVLTDLVQSNRSIHTRRAYAADLTRFVSCYGGPANGITADVLRAFFASLAHLSPASRARKQAALASFLGWAYRHEWIDVMPMARVERVRLDPPAPRGLMRPQIEAILTAIPAAQRRDHLLFRLIFETGLRVSEAVGIYVEDIDLTRDDEHVSVRGKGGRRRTILLDDSNMVDEVRRYLRRTGYTHGHLFRAQKNGRGGPLRYQSIHERWQGYCTAADVSCTLHQLRHTHATELVNGGVSLATIRKRLGHKNLQTTLRYAEQSDLTADAEMRAWRRRRTQS